MRQYGNTYVKKTHKKVRIEFKLGLNHLLASREIYVSKFEPEIG